jgi:hypothetical protein
MTWKRRILLYLAGFGLGVVLLFMIFGEKVLTGWLPESRVRSLLQHAKSFQVDSIAACELRCNQQTIETLLAAIPTADLDLGKSLAQKNPCREYYLKLKPENKSIDAYFSVCPADSAVRLLHVYGEKNCSCK